MVVHLPLADMDICWPLLVGMGLVIGTLAGFFGVGGGFLLTPMLNALFGVPYEIAVGSSLSQMIGLSSSAAMQHGRMGHIDYRLGVLVLLGATGGAELGARALELLEGMGTTVIHGTELPVIDLVMSFLYVILLGSIGTSMIREAANHEAECEANGSNEEPDNAVIRFLHRIRQGPQVCLNRAGVDSISMWIPISAGVTVGALSGLLGVGGGVVLLPTLVYVIGCPTVIAIGTGLFQIIFTAAYGTYTHSIKGNVDFLLVLLLLGGAVVGAQVGASLTKRFDPTRLRGGFAVMTYVGLVVVLGKLIFRIFA